MKHPWKLDGRTIPGPVMDYLRKIAVRAVEEKGYSPEVVIDQLGLSRSGIYTWRRRFVPRDRKVWRRGLLRVLGR